MSQIYKQHNNLSDSEIIRYSRQIITSEFHVKGQESLKKSSVLIVGCGGLGNPVALYLAGAGIGKIGLVDSDSIELSNIHRQIGYTINDVGKRKVDILKKAIEERNPEIQVITHDIRLNKDNVFDIITKYNVIADCTDNLPTRYLLNEACYIKSIPLAMGSAVGWAGQFVFFHIDKDQACYRCIYSTPSMASINMSCNEKGIMGPVVGIIGSTQAMEIIKYLGLGFSSYSDAMFVYDAFSSRYMRVNLRPKVKGCKTCDCNLKELNDYEFLCDATSGKTSIYDKISPNDRIDVKKLKEILDNDSDAILIDVRPENEFKIAAHPQALNVPINDFMRKKDGLQILWHNAKFNGRFSRDKPTTKIIFICRRGNDSQRVFLHCKSSLQGNRQLNVCDVIGGYEAWKSEIDPNFPEY